MFLIFFMCFYIFGLLDYHRSCKLAFSFLRLKFFNPFLDVIFAE